MVIDHWPLKTMKGQREGSYLPVRVRR